MTRSRFRLGLPVCYNATDGTRTCYANKEEAQDDQFALIDDIIFSIAGKLEDKFALKNQFPRSKYEARPKLPGTGVEVVWFNERVQNEEFLNILAGDFMFATGSVLSVLLYMVLHMRSWAIAGVCMLEVFLSFPASHFFYRAFLQVTYMGYIHVLTVFIVLGVGADDAFVCFDVFEQSKLEPPETSGSLLGRLKWSSNRSSKAIFVTTFTTSAAFLVSSASPIMPIAAFGMFSAVMILMLFCFNVGLMPPLFTMRTRWCDGALCCCPCFARKKKEPEPPIPVGEPLPVGEAAIDVATDKPPADGVDTTPPAASTEEDMRALERFFATVYADAVENPYVRAGVLAAFTGLLVAGTVLTAQLTPPSENEKFVPDSIVLQRYINQYLNDFTASGDNLVAEVDVVWGLNGMDLSKVDRWDVTDRGKLQLDTSFDPSTPEAQTFLLDACTTIRDAPCNADGCAFGKLTTTSTPCLMEAYETWVNATYGLSIPVPQERFNSTLLEFASLTDSKLMYPSAVGTVDNATIMYIIYRYDSTLAIPDVAKVVRPVVDEWADMIASLNDAAPATLKSGAQTGHTEWKWMRVQEEIVYAMMLGMFICFIISFIALNLSTLNWIAATVSSVCIVGVVMTVLGVGCKGIMAWDLGVGETIAGVVLVGLSVDYCVHIANAYMESDKPLRADRTRDALKHMGISVSASAATTLLSASWLWACTLIFYAKFAFLITVTIVSSYLWAVVFLPCALATVGPQSGPQGEQGDLTPYYIAAKSFTLQLISKARNAVLQRGADMEEKKVDAVGEGRPV